MRTKILVVDDEPEIRSMLAQYLESDGFEVVTADDGSEALVQLRKERPAAVLMDLSMPRFGGMQALPEMKRLDPDVPVIICTAHTDVPTAVQAMRLGAYDYLTKPFDFDLVLLTVKRAVERHELGARLEELKTQGEGASLAERMGKSAAIASVISQVAQVARSNFTVLVHGETGTGKELVARAIHQQSPRSRGPFVVVDCGAIPETLIESELFGYEKGAFTGAMRRKEGQFQLAQAGTLFLDEIGNLPLSAQTKLLRVLEEREIYALGGGRPIAVDVRVIAASNVQFDEEIKSGRFRPDLYYRLSEFTIALPPLRDRREDIADLARRFIAEASMELRNPLRGIADEAMEILVEYDWPGNVRELKNVVRKAALLASDVITPEYLPPLASSRPAGRAAAAPPPVGEELSLREAGERAVREAVRQAIRQALRSAKGNKSQAARLLRTDYTTLHAKMKRYAISAREFSDA
jgi:two-component system nitrogen regulation response regulator GlnG